MKIRLDEMIFDEGNLVITTYDLWAEIEDFRVVSYHNDRGDFITPRPAIVTLVEEWVKSPEGERVIEMELGL